MDADTARIRQRRNGLLQRIKARQRIPTEDAFYSLAVCHPLENIVQPEIPRHLSPVTRHLEAETAEPAIRIGRSAIKTLSHESRGLAQCLCHPPERRRNQGLTTRPGGQRNRLERLAESAIKIAESAMEIQKAVDIMIAVR